MSESEASASHAVSYGGFRNASTTTRSASTFTAVRRACVSASAASAAARAASAFVSAVCASVSIAFWASTLVRMSASVSPTTMLSDRNTSTSMATRACSLEGPPADGSSWAPVGSVVTRLVATRAASVRAEVSERRRTKCKNVPRRRDVSAAEGASCPPPDPRQPQECNESRGVCHRHPGTRFSRGRPRERRRSPGAAAPPRRVCSRGSGRRRRTPRPRPAPRRDPRTGGSGRAGRAPPAAWRW